MTIETNSFEINDGKVSSDSESNKQPRRNMDENGTLSFQKFINYKKLEKIYHDYKLFSHEGLIPGFRETFMSKHMAFRIIWVVLILFGFGFTAYFMYSVLEEYYDEPTATKISQLQLKLFDFPQIFICLQNWKKEEALIKRNLSLSGINYLFSLPNTPVTLSDQPNGFNFQTAKTDFERFAKYQNLSTYDEALYLGSWDPSDISLLGYENAQVCFNISFSPQSKGNLTRGIYSVDFNQGFLSSETNNLLVGDDLIYSTDSDILVIRTGHTYNVQIAARKVKLLNRNGSPCKEVNSDKSISKMACIQACREEKLAPITTCKTLFKDDNIFDRKQNICSSLSNEQYFKNFTNALTNLTDFERVAEEFSLQYTTVNKILEECDDFCLDVCENIVYETTLVDKTNSATDNQTSLKFQLLYAKHGMMYIEETATYSFQSAVSNIGGQLGLWMGMSIITLFQIIFYFVNKCFNKEQ